MKKVLILAFAGLVATVSVAAAQSGFGLKVTVPWIGLLGYSLASLIF